MGTPSSHPFWLMWFSLIDQPFYGIAPFMETSVYLCASSLENIWSRPCSLSPSQPSPEALWNAPRKAVSMDGGGEGGMDCAVMCCEVQWSDVRRSQPSNFWDSLEPLMNSSAMSQDVNLKWDCTYGANIRPLNHCLRHMWSAHRKTRIIPLPWLGIFQPISSEGVRNWLAKCGIAKNNNKPSGNERSSNLIGAY